MVLFFFYSKLVVLAFASRPITWSTDDLPHYGQLLQTRSSTSKVEQPIKQTNYMFISKVNEYYAVINYKYKENM